MNIIFILEIAMSKQTKQTKEIFLVASMSSCLLMRTQYKILHLQLELTINVLL